MKLIFVFFLLILSSLSFKGQPLQSRTEPLLLEWKQELKGNYPEVTGLLIYSGKIYLTQTGDQLGSSVCIFSPQSDLLFNSTTYARIRSFFAYNNALYSMGDQQ